MPQIQQLPLGPLGTNCYVLACEQTLEAAIIDPAWDGAGLAQHIESSGWQLTHIVLTHSHFDHVGGLAELKRATAADIYVHQEANALLPAASRHAQHWGLPIAEPPLGDVMVSNGQALSVGSITLEVLYTPGHAPGHISLYSSELDIVFDGDVLFQGSIGRTDLPGGDMGLLLSSIRDKLLTLPDATQVLPGHGPITTIGAERRANPFLQDELW